MQSTADGCSHALPGRQAEGRRAFERAYLLRLFEAAGYNLSEAARRSGVDRRLPARAVQEAHHRPRRAASRDVFGTAVPLQRVKVPRRQAPAWMLDEAGEVRAAYADDYELVGTRAA
jgi:hypothetical protein